MSDPNRLDDDDDDDDDDMQSGEYETGSDDDYEDEDDEEGEEEDDEDEEEGEGEDDEDADEDEEEGEFESHDGEVDDSEEEDEDAEFATDGDDDDDDDDDDEEDGEAGAMVAYDEDANDVDEFADEPSDDDEEEEDDDEDEEDEDEESEELEDEPLVTSEEKVEETIEEEFHDEEEKKDDRCAPWIICIFCCCCICILIAIFIVLWLLILKDDSPDPTSAPSLLPSITPPSGAPSTLSPSVKPSNAPSFMIPEVVELPAIGDTYLRNGPFADSVLGGDNEILIQNIAGDESGTGIGLLSFDLTSLQRYVDAGATIPAVLLRIHHIATNVFPAPATSQISISKLLGSEELDVETLAFGNFTRPSVVVLGPEFNVGNNDQEMDVDITNLVLSTPTSSGRRVRRGRRYLQQQVLDSRLVLLLEGTEGSTATFRSREYENGGFTPMLTISLGAPGGGRPGGPGGPGGPSSPSSSLPTPPTLAPTSAPTVTPQPSTSPQPSAVPTVSQLPTVSSQPSTAPSVSHAPSASTSPSGKPSAAPSNRPTSRPTPVGGTSPPVERTPTTAPTTMSPTITSPPSNNPTFSPKPSVSAMPSSRPTVSNAPSISSRPSAAPTGSSAPTTTAPTSSQNPTGCYEASQPQLNRMFGTGNPVEANEVIHTIAQKGFEVKFDITQVWTKGTNETISWIAPYWANLDEGETFFCERTYDVPTDARLIYTAPCYSDGFARVAVIVNDEMFEEGTNLILPRGCAEDPRDIRGKKTSYNVQIPCTATCDFSASPTGAPLP